jgi:hypothetical protein
MRPQVVINVTSDNIHNLKIFWHMWNESEWCKKEGTKWPGDKMTGTKWPGTKWKGTNRRVTAVSLPAFIHLCDMKMPSKKNTMSHIKDIHNVASRVISCDSRCTRMWPASAPNGLSDMKDAIQNAPCNLLLSINYASFESFRFGPFPFRHRFLCGILFYATFRFSEYLILPNSFMPPSVLAPLRFGPFPFMPLSGSMEITDFAGFLYASFRRLGVIDRRTF